MDQDSGHSDVKNSGQHDALKQAEHTDLRFGFYITQFAKHNFEKCESTGAIFCYNAATRCKGMRTIGGQPRVSLDQQLLGNCDVGKGSCVILGFTQSSGLSKIRKHAIHKWCYICMGALGENTDLHDATAHRHESPRLETVVLSSSENRTLTEACNSPKTYQKHTSVPAVGFSGMQRDCQ